MSGSEILAIAALAIVLHTAVFVAAILCDRDATSSTCQGAWPTPAAVVALAVVLTAALALAAAAAYAERFAGR